MNWLLTNCAAPRMAPFGTGEKRPPLGIGFLASALRNTGHDIRFIDNYLRPSDFLETDYLNQHRIDAIGVSASTICAHDLHRMLGRLKQMREAGVWTGKVVVGGPHTTAVPDDMPEWVDHVVQGEGEDPIVRIAEGETERVLSTSRTEDLDALAPPAWDLFANLPYDWTASWLKVAPVFTMNTSRGCPFKCTFCSTPDIWGRAYRYFSADWVIEQIKHLVTTYGAKGIYFREDNFSVHRKRVTEFCEKLLRAGVDIQWVCETRVDTLKRGLLELMHRAGCRGIYVGVESGSQRVLDYMQKDIKLEEVHDVFRWCNEIGIRTYASFVVGVPTETPDERALTVAMPEKIHASTHSMNVFVGVPTSRLYHHILQNKLYAHIDDRGLVYLKDHDALVDEFYGGNEARKIPTSERVEHVLREGLTTDGRKPGEDLDSWIGLVRDLLLRRPNTRRVVAYGVGTNGQLLLRGLRESACLGDRELLAADDDDDPLTFKLLDLPREWPREWTSWPDNTIVVVTPNDCDAMCAVLKRGGGCDGRDFIALATGTAKRPVSQARQEPRPASTCARPSASRPDVSIIVACYNAAETVGETIASVQAQTHRNWELICIDDESSDRTPEVLASLADGDDRICWERVPHQGQPATKNRGVPLARADHILFLDADDVLRPDALETLLQVSQRVGDDAIIAGGYELLDSAGRPLSIYRFPTVREFSVDEFLRSNRISVVSLAPRRLLDDAPFDESLDTCIDWDLWLRLASSGARCVTIPRVIFGYRLHPGSLSRHIDTVYESGRAVLERWLPHARDAAACRDVLHRWAAAQGAMAFASGEPDAIQRYFADLPAPEPGSDFPLAVASALSHAIQFVHEAKGDGRCATASREPAKVYAWLRSGPLATWSDAILAEFVRTSAVGSRDLDAARDFLSANQHARRVVIYGLGANGVTLLERLRNEAATQSLELVGADDHAESLTFEMLGLPRNDPRRWREWPKSTVVIVTPNNHAAMRATLRAAGGREGEHFFVLTNHGASVGGSLEAAGVVL